jgi:PST family polysaccharide transporter
MTRWVPGRPRYGTGLWSMIWYAADVTAFRIVTHLGKHLDRILLSASAGPASVGLYSLADRWASMPGQMIYGQLGSVANSAFARLRDEPARFRDYYRQAMKLVWSVMLPLLAGIGLEAEAVLLVLAGDQWIEAIPLLRILAVAALALAVSHTTKWFYLAEGRTRAQLIWGTIAAVVTAAGVAAGVRWGVTGVAVGFCAATVLLVPASMGVWLRGSQIEAGDVGRAIWRPAAATLVMAGAWWLLPELDGRAILRLLWSVPLLAGVYCLAWRSLPGGGQAWLDCKRVARLLR